MSMPDAEVGACMMQKAEGPSEGGTGFNTLVQHIDIASRHHAVPQP